MKILAVGAHPDDIEISCAGTLAKMTQAGHEVVLCHASKGDKGHFHIPPDELSEIRGGEAQAAGRLIGCEVLSLGLQDGEILNDYKFSRQAFIDLMRVVRPDMVITHAPNDYMSDHVGVSQLVLDSSFFATVPGTITNHPAAHKVPAIFYMDNLSGIGFEPSIYVDVTGTFETKLNMLAQHQSQLVWLKEHDGVDILDLVTTLGKSRGIQAGCAYAEAYIRHIAWTRPNTLRFPV